MYTKTIFLYLIYFSIINNLEYLPHQKWCTEWMTENKNKLIGMVCDTNLFIFILCFELLF